MSFHTLWVLNDRDATRTHIEESMNLTEERDKLSLVYKHV